MNLYGEQTRRAIQNFPISGWAVPGGVLRMLASIKRQAALANGRLKLIPSVMAKRIAASAEEIRNGNYADQFPVDVFQTGSGTSTNMNMNEVLATLASTKTEKVHPNDHVNRCQSSNDVFPTAVQLACAVSLKEDVLPALKDLEKALQTKAKAWAKVQKIGRTHFMDAVPLSLGTEFAGYARLISDVEEEIEVQIAHLSRVPLGGTAVGNGTNAHPKFAALVLQGLKKEWQISVSQSLNRTAAQSCPLALLQAANGLLTASTALAKIAGDIRMMGSGPVGGFNELFLPELQAGSSIMPGKVNPVLCESMLQMHAYVAGVQHTVATAVAMNSQFELCTAYPVMAHSLLTAIEILSDATTLFTEKCIAGLRPNLPHLKRVLEASHMTVTALAPLIGYDEAAAIVKESQKTGETVLAVAKRRTKLSEKTLRTLLNPQ